MNIIEKILEIKILPIFRNAKQENILEYAYILREEGVNLIEVTLSDQQSFKIIQYLKTNIPDIIVGAGTVLTPDQVSKALEVGAQFIVSPGYSESILSLFKSGKHVIIPGVATAAEIMNVMSYGIQLVKVFPAVQLTPVFFKEMRGPFPDIKMIAVGGITTKNAKIFIEAGVNCIGVGSGLFKDELGQDVTKKEFRYRLKLFKQILKIN